MNTIEKILNIPINNSSLDDYLKNEFQKKNHLAVLHEFIDEFDLYKFSFIDKIREIDAQINVDVYISSQVSTKLLYKMIIFSPTENINEYDLEHYFFSQLYYPITINDYGDKKERYTVRTYYSIIHDIGFKGEYVIKWEGKVKFKPLFNEMLR